MILNKGKAIFWNQKKVLSWNKGSQNEFQNNSFTVFSWSVYFSKEMEVINYIIKTLFHKSFKLNVSWKMISSSSRSWQLYNLNRVCLRFCEEGSIFKEQWFSTICHYVPFRMADHLLLSKHQRSFFVCTQEESKLTFEIIIPLFEIADSSQSF